jgi:hypothetical protein
MAATTTASPASLSKRIRADHPQFVYQSDEHHFWSATARTIHFTPAKTMHDVALLLHELAHALLDHRDYHQDIELIAMEESAWQKARSLAATYDLVLDEAHTEDHLETYRLWLHGRSRCPSCQGAGVQSRATSAYYCALCDTQWRANEAKLCGLRRYQV